jgi:hypothetical protein
MLMQHYFFQLMLRLLMSIISIRMVQELNQVRDSAAAEEIYFGNGFLTSAPHNNITTHDDFASTVHEQYGENNAMVNATKRFPSEMLIYGK